VQRMFLIITVVGVMLAVGASLALAQPQGPVTATGVLGPAFTRGEDPTPNYLLTDEETGTTYTLISGFVDLEDYVGQRATITGERVPSIDPSALNVTDVVPLGTAPPPPPPEQCAAVYPPPPGCPGSGTPPPTEGDTTTPAPGEGGATAVAGAGGEDTQLPATGQPNNIGGFFLPIAALMIGSGVLLVALLRGSRQ
jgi:hypothetical protein